MTDHTTTADGAADDNHDQGKQGLQTSPDNFTDGYAPAGDLEGPAAAGYAPGAVSPATADALERALADWSDTVTGPLARSADADADTARVLAAVAAAEAEQDAPLLAALAERDAADSALLAAAAAADALSPELLAALADADDWSADDGDGDQDDSAPGGEHP